MVEEFTPRLVGFLCNWCTYAAADLAGTAKLEIPWSLSVIRVMCSGRVDPVLAATALLRGADGVLVAGCHPGDCHYISGNLVARRKFALLKNFLTYLGIEPDRIHFSWVSASEGNRFAALIEKVTNEVRKLGPAKKLVKESL